MALSVAYAQGGALLATNMRPVCFEAGETLMTEGEPGDGYVIIETGEVEVSAGGRLLHRLGPGEGIGEIALLRDSPRTATVVVVEAVEGWTIDRRTFLDAVTGHEGSAAAAETVVVERLGRGSAGPR